MVYIEILELYVDYEAADHDDQEKNPCSNELPQVQI
jgi:hypothetical protein